MTIQTFVCNPYQENTYVVSGIAGCPKEQAFLIDPGMYTPSENEAVARYIEEQHLQLQAVLVTHGHPDHTCGLEYLNQLYPNLPVGNDDTKDWTNYPCECLRTPGHSQDAVCYYFRREGILFSGDTLFQNSVGRTDLPGGDWTTLMQSLQKLVNELPPQTIVYPGHGARTTMAQEQKYNPYL